MGKERVRETDVKADWNYKANWVFLGQRRVRRCLYDQSRYCNDANAYNPKSEDWMHPGRLIPGRAERYWAFLRGEMADKQVVGWLFPRYDEGTPFENLSHGTGCFPGHRRVTFRSITQCHLPRVGRRYKRCSSVTIQGGLALLVGCGEIEHTHRYPRFPQERGALSTHSRGSHILQFAKCFSGF